jgi:hypothetical protein
MYELVRKTLIITLCLMLSKVLHLSISVYMVLFAVVLANTSYSKQIPDLIQRLSPSVLSAIGAMIINDMFAAHRFIIWTICIVYFDHVRRHAKTNLQIRSATLPLFMIIFVTTFHSSSNYTLLLPTFIRDVIINAFIAVLVTSAINNLMPIKVKVTRPTVISQPVTGADRLKLLLLVGTGLAFIMINEVTSAVFCLVPLITSAMQPTHAHMKDHSREKIISQIGGCSLAVITALFYSSTKINMFSYFAVSFLLIYLLLYWSHYAEPKERAIHADALMGFLIPYQLYVGTTGQAFELSSIALRATELLIALVIIYVVAHWLDLLAKTENTSQTN